VLGRDEEGEGEGEMSCEQQAGEARSLERKGQRDQLSERMGQRDQLRESEFTRNGNIRDKEAGIYDTETERAQGQQIQLSQVVLSATHSQKPAICGTIK
jgi:hypothetical protein